MTAATGVLDSAELEAALYDGLVNEDVMQKIYDLSPTEVKFTTSIGTGKKAERAYVEWTKERLSAPDKTNAVVDGQNIIGQVSNAAAFGERVGNHCQESVKYVQLSTRGQKVDSIGNVGRMVRQLSRRQQELKRDIEAIMLGEQASVADNGMTTSDGDPSGRTAGKAAAYFAWIETNAYGGATGSNGGFDTSAGVVDAPGAGTPRALSEEMVRTACEDVFTTGGNPTIFMAIPKICSAFSNYLFTSSARIATLQSNTGQSKQPLTAQGAVNVFVSDHGVTLDLISNRIMQPEVATPGSERANIAIYDPEYLEMRWLSGIRSEPLAKTGLADNRQLVGDWTLAVLTEDAHAAIRDIDYTLAVTAETA